MKRLKSDIKKVIRENTDYIADQVYDPDIKDYGKDNAWMTLEIKLHKKAKKD